MRKSLGKKQETEKFSQSSIPTIWKKNKPRALLSLLNFFFLKDKIDRKNKTSVSPNYCHMFGYT